MSWTSSEVIGVLVFLLPGILAASIFYSLTSHPKPGTLDQVIQALIFTAIGQAATAALLLIFNLIWEHPQWTKYYELQLVLSVFVAIVVGLAAAAISPRLFMEHVDKGFRPGVFVRSQPSFS